MAKQEVKADRNDNPPDAPVIKNEKPYGTLKQCETEPKEFLSSQPTPVFVKEKTPYDFGDRVIRNEKTVVRKEDIPLEIPKEIDKSKKTRMVTLGAGRSIEESHDM
jgi:hypothetical protein